MTLRRSMVTLVLMLGLLAGTMTTAFAATSSTDSSSSSTGQRATPASDSGSSSSGKAIKIGDENGDPSLEITLSNFQAKWKDYDDYSAPDRGAHYVYFELKVKNVGDRSVDVSSYDFFVRDSDGFLYGSAYAGVGDGTDTAKKTAFDPSDGIAAGDTVSGYLIVEVPNESTLTDIFYAPSGRLITLATLDSGD